ncbi:MAG: hypothetical protein FRX49_10910 [Trebouxia sp. A1-2]|nr:MAG: hypothetical protein FRX49_10910 [Trebouxia sp. A1-2]
MWIPCDQEEAEEVALQSTAQLACGGVSQGRGDPQWMHGSVIPPMGNAILETASGKSWTMLSTEFVGSILTSKLPQQIFQRFWGGWVQAPIRGMGAASFTPRHKGGVINWDCLTNIAIPDAV